jgi:hypothetical protein
MSEAPTPDPPPNPFAASHYSTLEFFTWDHLPPHLQAVSRPFGELALAMTNDPMQHDFEIEAGLRKLLEAKDCFVRAALRMARRGPPLPGTFRL